MNKTVAFAAVLLVAFCATSALAHEHKKGFLHKALHKVESFTTGTLNSVKHVVHEHRKHHNKGGRRGPHHHPHPHKGGRDGPHPHPHPHPHPEDKDLPINSREIPPFMPGLVMPAEDDEKTLPINSKEIPPFMPGLVMPVKDEPRPIDSTEIPPFIPGIIMPKEEEETVQMTEMTAATEKVQEPMINNVVYNPEKYGVHSTKKAHKMQGGHAKAPEDLPVLNMKNPFSKRKDEVAMTKMTKMAKKQPMINNVVYNPEKYGVQKKKEKREEKAEPVLNQQKKLVTKDIGGHLKKKSGKKPKTVFRKVGNFKVHTN